MRILRTNFVWICFFITFTILMLDTTDNVPGMEIMRFIRYPFMVYMLYENIKYIGINKIHFYPSLCMGLLVLHTVLFGFVFTNPYVDALTKDHFRQLSLFIVLVCLVARFCYYTNTKKQFIISTFLSYLTFLTWSYVTHLNGLAPIRYLIKLPQIFINQMRYGFTFGMGFRSITGNYGAISVIILIIAWLYRSEFTGNMKKYHQLLFFVGATVFGAVLITSASRAEILSVVCFIFVLTVLILKDKVNFTIATRFIFHITIIIMVFALVVMLVQTTFETGSLSNRANNWSVNIEAFTEQGNYLTGMGYLEQHAFLNDAYEQNTWPCDVYYLYIFFSTGILGSIIMGSHLLLLMCGMFFGKTDDRKYDYIMFALMVTMLFNNMYHCTFNSYYNLSSLIVEILFVVHLYEVEDYKKEGKVRITDVR